VSLRILCIRRDDLPGDGLGLVELLARDKQRRELDLGVGVLRIERGRFEQLMVRCPGVIRTQISARKLIVRSGKSGVDFDRVTELDDGFLELTFVEVALAALQVLELFCVRVERACRQEHQSQHEDS
jgi:hypothetical protein